ncbi:MAG: GNAT family N-acetyltransferase [Butyricicoccus sp.]|nr:GNAT family N-acetyltransferase [Butyricicoccus sp.]
MEIRIIPGYSHPAEIRALFTEYTQMLLASDGSFREYLDIQHYGDELANLEAKYGAPSGRLYLAMSGGTPAGCIALRRIDALRCEMKRLYVRPQFRNLGIGNRLVERIIADARETGYKQMLLDTLPFLDYAIKLYAKYGFYETGSYNDSPMRTSIFMALDL